jgi:hypothetical protein
MGMTCSSKLSVDFQGAAEGRIQHVNSSNFVRFEFFTVIIMMASVFRNINAAVVYWKSTDISDKHVNSFLVVKE